MTGCRSVSPERGDIDAWLTGDAGAEPLEPAANEVLQTWPVPRRANGWRTSDENASLINRTESVALIS